MRGGIKMSKIKIECTENQQSRLIKYMTCDGCPCSEYCNSIQWTDDEECEKILKRGIDWIIK